MAHEVDGDATGKRTLQFTNGRVEDADDCVECGRRPTSHPSGECSECREDA